MQQNHIDGQIIVRHPEPPKDNSHIFPLFMPFAGCKSRCIFCSQEIQTGTAPAANRARLQTLLAGLDEAMEQRQKAALPPVELAFFGGTFTATPPEWQEACLQRAAHWKKQGQIKATRCSTRPDAISPSLLNTLRKKGLDTVELGIQSFAGSALSASRRGYSPDTAHAACRMVQDAGLTLGIQLMPGLPGQSPKQAMQDVHLAIAASPTFVRLYPCLVFAETPLEQLWLQGGFTPLETEAAIAFLGEACLRFWRNNIRVIRMGIAPEPSALQGIVAGPFHPAMGARARARALYLLLRESMEAHHAATCTPPARWCLTGPKRHQGEFWGHQGEMRKDYAQLGIDKIIWENRADFALNRLPAF